jgi:hypothetical protein
MLRRLTPYLVAAAVALTSILSLVARPATGAPGEHADYAVIAGAAGLRWDDLNPTDTPTLWKLAEHGSIGALSVSSARTPTCPVDGWLTLGAGNYTQRAAGTVESVCPPTEVKIQTPDGIGANLPDQETDVAAINRALPYNAQPGALAEAVRCTAAVGPGAAIAAARPYGRVDRYESSLPKNPAALLSSCVLSIVDLGTIAGNDPAVRQAQARAADATLARVLAARPARSLLMVAGLSDTDLTSRLHVAIADGPGYRGGWLTSSSTSRPGYVQLIDLAATALNALNRPAPTGLFSGQPADSISGRPSGLTTAVSRLADADREAGAQRRVTGWFLTVLAVGELLLFAAVVPFLRRARRHAGPYGPRPMPARLVRVLEVLLVAASVTLPAALIADVVPWWRSDQAGLVFTAATVVMVAVLTTVAVSGPWRRGALGPIGAVGGIVAGIVGLDVLTGARLQLNGVAGYSALEGGRYAGVGALGLGLLIAGTLLLAGWLAQRLDRRWRPVIVAAVGGIGVVLVGSPYLGANAGGAVALTAGVCVAAAICTGGFLTFVRLAWATLTGLAVTVGFALLDLRRPVEDRGSLGAFLTQARNGTSGSAVNRVGADNVVAVMTGPLTLVVLGAAILIMFVLLRPWGGLKRLFGIYPPVRAVLIGAGVAALLAGLLDGAGFNVAGAAAATCVPLACLAALRVLDHADDRTVATRSEPDAGTGSGSGSGLGAVAEARAAATAEATSDSPSWVPGRSVRRRLTGGVTPPTTPCEPAGPAHRSATPGESPAAAAGDVLP